MYGSASEDHAKLRQKILDKTLNEKPEGATHWSTRTRAREVGANQMFVSRVWRENGLKPHLTKQFKLSNDPNFQDKLVPIQEGVFFEPGSRGRRPGYPVEAAVGV